MKPENILLYALVGVSAVAFLFFALSKPYIASWPLPSATAIAPATATDPGTVPESPAMKKAETAYTSTRRLVNGVYVTTIAYDGKRFTPPVATVNRGEVVRFVNDANGTTMRIVSNVFNGSPLYGAFDETQSVGKGGAFALSMSEPGVWGYHNLNGDPDIIGVIYVR